MDNINTSPSLLWHHFEINLIRAISLNIYFATFSKYEKKKIAFPASSPHSWPQSNDHKPRVLRFFRSYPWNLIGSAQKRSRSTLKLDPNASSHRVRPPPCTLSVLRARRADVSVGWFIRPGFLPSPPTDSVSFLPAHAVPVPLRVHPEDSEPGQRRHLGTYFIKITRCRFTGACWRRVVAWEKKTDGHESCCGHAPKGLAKVLLYGH